MTDSVTSNGLTTFISSMGGKHFRFKRGYKNVIGKGVELMKQGVDCQLMMETRCVWPPTIWSTDEIADGGQIQAREQKASDQPSGTAS